MVKTNKYRENLKNIRPRRQNKIQQLTPQRKDRQIYTYFEHRPKDLNFVHNDSKHETISLDSANAVPTAKNCTPELPTFGAITGINPATYGNTVRM
jgi:hypothetical protein